MEFCFAKKEESQRVLPGDTIIDKPMVESTHAISIKSNAKDVWPWIVQIGQDRGGFYSYTILENMIGCKMKNADRIHPEWQQVSVNDQIQLHPKFPPLLVNELEHGSHVVLAQETSFQWTWTFAILQLSQDACRLLVRTRMSNPGLPLSLLLYPVMTLGHYFMERKMLTEIKRRSENPNIEAR